MTQALTTHIVAGCLLQKDNKILLIQEGREDIHGLWNLPMGKVDVGETIEQAAIRETKEECGYDVRLNDEVGLYHSSAESPVIHAFTADIIGGELQYPVDELLDAQWFKLEEIRLLSETNKLRTTWLYDLAKNTIT